MRVICLILTAALLGAAPPPLPGASPGDDRVAGLIGTWTCRDGVNAVSTLTVSRERDAIVAKEVKPAPNGQSSTDTQRYRFDAAGGRWTVDDYPSGYSEYHGTAPPWSDSEWNVDGTMTVYYGGNPSRSPRALRFVRGADGVLYRGEADDASAHRVAGEVCALGGMPPDPALCPAARFPATTLHAAPPQLPPGERGTVNVRVSLDADARVTGASVASSTNPAMNAGAVAMARDTQFRTEYRDCRPVPSEYIFTVQAL